MNRRDCNSIASSVLSSAAVTETYFMLNVLLKAGNISLFCGFERISNLGRYFTCDASCFKELLESLLCLFIINGEVKGCVEGPAA